MELIRDVVVKRSRSGLVRQKNIMYVLLLNLFNEKASKDYGYFLSVTSLKSISKQEVLDKKTRDMFLSVVFKCRTFLPRRGEILEGVVYHMFKRGVLLRCGPMKNVYLSIRKMPNYIYLSGKNPVFFNNNGLRKIEINVVVRFVVFGVRWIEERGNIKNEFEMLATIEGDESLGPLSLCEDDGSYL